MSSESVRNWLKLRAFKWNEVTAMQGLAITVGEVRAELTFYCNKQYDVYSVACHKSKNRLISEIFDEFQLDWSYKETDLVSKYTLEYKDGEFRSYLARDGKIEYTLSFEDGECTFVNFSDSSLKFIT